MGKMCSREEDLVLREYIQRSCCLFGVLEFGAKAATREYMRSRRVRGSCSIERRMRSSGKEIIDRWLES